MSNIKTYESTDIVCYYLDYSELQKPEAALIASLREELKDMRMLDIGVGGGRTTHYFAPLVKDYLGIDYSVSMIEACRNRFPDVSFAVSDIRSMHDYADDSFDFILFSFNGLDYISHDDRIRALNEIRRVGVHGGLFFFSTHNLLSIDRLFRVRFTVHPLKLVWRLTCHILLRLLNQKSVRRLKQVGHAILNDGTHGFRLRTYYIRPREQVKQLEKLHFTDIHVYSVDTGEEIMDPSGLDMIQDGWVYYRATINKN